MSLIIFPLLAALFSAPGDYEKLSPFSAVQWDDWTARVEVDGVWYTLVGIDEVKADDLIGFCRKAYGRRAKKRFTEDLVQALSEMGHRPAKTVDLVVRAGKSEQVKTLKGVAMTAANRQALWRANLRASGRDRPSGLSVKRIDRRHASGVPAEFSWLTTRIDPDGTGPAVSAPEAAKDLDQLEYLLKSRHSYLKRRDVDHEKILDAIRAGLGDGISLLDFGLQLEKAIALLGDGHARVRGPSLRGNHFLPFLIDRAGDCYVAFEPDRSGFVLDGAPRVTRIDDVAIDRWVEAASRYAPRVAEHFVRRCALRTLRNVNLVRHELGLKFSRKVEVTFASLDGRAVKKGLFDLETRKALHGVWPRARSRLLDGAKIGYLRIPEMNSGAAVLVREMMHSFRECSGLIVDVRGNGGGSRDAIRALFPFLTDARTAPHVANVAAYRLADDFPLDHLEARFMHRPGAGLWTAAQRRAIERCRGAFTPEWALPAGEFSDWHYFVLDRSLDPGAFHFAGPVAVLIDENCFSATDIFVGALKGWRNVVLVGLPTGGGSGRSMTVQLHHSRITGKLSSMASFRPDGKLYDGNGIEPDVRVDRTAADLIGRTDTQLDRARAFLLDR